MGAPYRSLLTASDLHVKESDTAIRISMPMAHLFYQPEGEGLVVHSNGELQFQKSAGWNRHLAELITLSAAGARVETTLPAISQSQLMQVTDKDLELINESHALRTLSADDVRLYDRWVINNQPTRSGLVFTERALRKFAQDFTQGRTVLMFHDQTIPVGRTFKAQVASDTIRGVQGKWVKLRLYIPVRDELGERIDETRFPITMLDAGVLAFDSIGFGGGKFRGVRVGEGDSERFFLEVDHDPSQQFELEAGELSFVFMGNVKGAGNNKQGHALGDRGGMPDPAASGGSGADSQKPSNHQTIERWVIY